MEMENGKMQLRTENEIQTTHRTDIDFLLYSSPILFHFPLHSLNPGLYERCKNGRRKGRRKLNQCDSLEMRLS